MTTLVIAPHADDEVLGVGGTIARLSDEGEHVTVAVLTGHGDEPHPLFPPDGFNIVRAECKKACKKLGVKNIIFKDLPAACLDYTPTWKINSIVTDVLEEVRPNTVFVPFSHDLHKDHGAIAYAVSVATRPYLELGQIVKQIYAYETLSETHLSSPYLEAGFQPNSFWDISKYIETKLEAFSEYQSQIQVANMPRSLNSLRALSTLRGSHIGVAAAEAFILIRQSF